MKRLKDCVQRWMLVFLFLGTPIGGQAVELSTDGGGQAILIPYYNARQGNTTLLTLRSLRAQPQVLKVRFRDLDGQPLSSFNLYLTEFDAWVGAVDWVDNETRLILPDDSCVISESGVDPSALTLASGSGFVEVIEMAAIDWLGEEGGQVYDLLKEEGCNAINSLWSSGEWSDNPEYGLAAPIGSLSGTGSIINVARGVQFSFEAVALKNFSNIVQHTPAGEELPDLSSTHDDGTPQGRTRSKVCLPSGCIDEEWALPIDAVSSVLTAIEHHAEYSIEPEINAVSEAVVTYPLRAQYESRFPEEPANGNYDQRVYTTDRNGVTQASNNYCTVAQIFGCTPYIARGGPPHSINVLPFGQTADQDRTEITTPLFGETVQVFYPTMAEPSLPESGRFSVTFFGVSDVPNLQSLGGSQYWGHPSVGLMFTEVTNGQLTDEEGNRVRANYGSTVRMSVHQEKP